MGLPISEANEKPNLDQNKRANQKNPSRPGQTRQARKPAQLPEILQGEAQRSGGAEDGHRAQGGQRDLQGSQGQTSQRDPRYLR